MNTKIRTCWINITSGCNNKCVFCYYKNKGDKNIDIKTLEKYARFLKKMDVKNLILIGGEPTIHPDFLNIVSMFSEKYGLTPSVVTNGKKLADKSFAREVMKHSKVVTFSIEGTEKIHNALTGTNSFYSTIQGLKNCIEIDGRKIGTNTTISSQNVDNLPTLIDLLYKLGMRRMGFNMCSDFEPSNALMSPREFARKTQRIFREKRKQYNDMKFTVITPQPLCLYDEDTREMYAGNCHIYNGSGLVIDVDGSILLCTHWIQYKLAKINPAITVKGFYKLWSNLGAYRQEIKRYPSNKCMNCLIWGKCIGGCPIIWRVFDAQKEIPGLKIGAR